MCVAFDPPHNRILVYTESSFEAFLSVADTYGLHIEVGILKGAEQPPAKAVLKAALKRKPEALVDTEAFCAQGELVFCVVSVLVFCWVIMCYAVLRELEETESSLRATWKARRTHLVNKLIECAKEDYSNAQQQLDKTFAKLKTLEHLQEL